MLLICTFFPNFPRQNQARDAVGKGEKKKKDKLSHVLNTFGINLWFSHISEQEIC